MTDRKDQKRGLGRGLSALMADIAAPEIPDAPRSADMMVPIERVHPNPEQPRRSFTPDQLQELTESVRERGIIQPLIVRPHPDKIEHYQIVAGERRWRAAQMAQVHEIPVLVRDYDDATVLEVAIIENIQRADLNAAEEAAAFRQLMDRFGHTQEKLAAALGKSRSHIANTLRLLSLPDDVLTYVRQGLLTAGHARALVGLPNAGLLARTVVSRNLSVRETERLAKGASEGGRRSGSGPRKRSADADKDADTRALENDLAAALGLGVSISHLAGDEGGEITLRYGSLDQLDDLCRRLTQGV